jgi:hypothetical protein
VNPEVIETLIGLLSMMLVVLLLYVIQVIQDRRQ